jgi:ferredoxin
MAPEVYDADDVGHSMVLIEDVSGDMERQALTGARNCPEQTIVLTS